MTLFVCQSTCDWRSRFPRVFHSRHHRNKRQPDIDRKRNTWNHNFSNCFRFAWDFLLFETERSFTVTEGKKSTADKEMSQPGLPNSSTQWTFSSICFPRIQPHLLQRRESRKFYHTAELSTLLEYSVIEINGKLNDVSKVRWLFSWVKVNLPQSNSSGWHANISQEILSAQLIWSVCLSGRQG